jgi:hypothetical protein
MIVKLASAILAGAGIALAVAPPAIASPESYITELSSKGYMAIVSNSPDRWVAIGMDACDKMRDAMERGDESPDNVFNWLSTEVPIDRNYAHVIAHIARKNLCENVQFFGL